LFGFSAAGASGPVALDSPTGALLLVAIGTIWALVGLWLIASADRLRGFRPLDAFVVPGGMVAPGPAAEANGADPI
jgi:hypothetical protein